MKIDEIEIDDRVIGILKGQGIEELYPPQEASIGYALNGENLVLSVPTAGGKSLVAYLAMLKSVLNGGKAMYIVPLRALASEKFEDLKIFESIGVKVALSYGDLDSPEPELESFDIIIVTSEKADSLLRHRSHWLKKITVVVADEIHLINDPKRGPTLETILSRFKENAQIIGLSATIKNSEELAEWLNARHVKSDWRPVPLKEGVYLDGAISFIDNTTKKIKKEKDEIVSLVSDT
ncbi:MAG: DEAD/DEAH box helicase, partial [Thermoplasmatales archaeon]|nr:DEAD/DEAH box helicase [Thermoplasmatales archaeon]